MDTVLDSNQSGRDVGIPDLSVDAPVRPVRAGTLHNRIEEYIATTKSQCCARYIDDTRKELEELELYLHKHRLDHAGMMHYGEWLLRKTTTYDAHACLKAARQFTRWLWKMRYTSDNLSESFAKIDLPPAKTLARIITEEEYQRLLETTKNTGMAWGIVCAYHTGFRLKDVCLLKWESVDLERQLITTTPHKTQRRGIRVEIPIITDSDLHIWLLKMRDDRIADEPFVSRALHCSYISGRCCIGAHFSVAFKKAGVKGSFHAFRATMDSRLLNNGVPIAVAAKITGRSDTRSLMRYVVPDMDMVRLSVAQSFERKEKPVIIYERRINTEANQPTAGPLQGTVHTGGIDTGATESAPVAGADTDFSI